MKRNIWTDDSPYGTYEGNPGNPSQWKSTFQFSWDQKNAEILIKKESPWSILNIPENSSLAVAKKAFHQLMLIHHPDKGGNTETCQKIISAFVLIKNKT
jgi:hypothetical protein